MQCEGTGRQKKMEKNAQDLETYRSTYTLKLVGHVSTCAVMGYQWFYTCVAGFGVVALTQNVQTCYMYVHS